MQYRNIDKQALKENGYTVLSKITIVGTDTVFTEDDHIVNWDYEDYRYVPNNGFIGQFVERILDGNLQDISEDVILEDTEINLQLGIKNALDNDTITWYNYGNFLITKVEKTDTTGNYKFESADYTKKFNIPFKIFYEREQDGETEFREILFPCLASELADYTCAQAGLELDGYDANNECWYHIINNEDGLDEGNYHFTFNDGRIKYVKFTLDDYLSKYSVIEYFPKKNKMIIKKVNFLRNNNGAVYKYEIPYTISTTKDNYTALVYKKINLYDFENNDFVIEGNQYNSDETCRKVMQDIGKLAYSWVRIGEDNKVHIDFTPRTTSSVDQYDQLTTDEYYVSKKSDLAFGPVNKVLIGMSDVEGENMYETSPDYTEETECAIKIYDNNLTNTDELRAIALNGCDRLFGLTYTPIEINSVGHPWLDGDELIKLTNVDDEVIYTYPFNRKITYAGYIEGTIGAEAHTTQESKYEYKSDIISNVKKTAFIVDKQAQVITATVEKVDEDSDKISQLRIDVNGIEARVSGIETTEVVAVTNEYAVNSSATTPPEQSSSSWSETKPTRGEGQYIWARIKTTYKDESVEYSDPVNTTGDKGDSGKGISTVTYYYKATNTQTQPSADSITSTTIPTLDGVTNKYLWRKEVTTYTNGTSNTIVSLSGVHGSNGEDGNGIQSITYYYKATSTQTQPSAASITSTSIPTLDATTNKYLWQKEVIKYTDTSIADKVSVSLIGVHGGDGDNGASIDTVTQYYAVSDDNETPPSSWTTDLSSIELTPTNKYLWNYERITYTEGKEATETGKRVIGVYGDSADPAVMYHNAKGTEISTTDAGDIELKSVNSIEGNTSQVQYTGKNKIPTSDTISTTGTTSNGITFTLLSDGTIKANGTATAGVSIYLTNDWLVFPAGTYTISDGIASGQSGTTFFLFADVQHSSGSAWDEKYFSTAGSFTRQIEETFRFRPRIVVRQGQTLNNLIFKPQFETGSSPTDYEPYVGGIPSPNPNYPQDIHVVSGDNYIDICGKNLANPSDIYDGYPTGSNGRTIGFNPSVNSITYRKCAYVVAGQPYTLGWKINTIKVVGSRDIKIVDNNNIILENFSYSNANNNRTRTFTPTYSGWVYAALDTNATEVQLEKGSTATTYEPYIGSSYPIYLGVENLFDVNVIQERTIQGITMTFNEQTIHLQGTATGNANFYMKSGSSFTLEAGTYFITRSSMNGVATLKLSSGSTTIVATGSTDISFTLSQATTIDGLTLQVPSSVGTINKDITISIVKGNKAQYISSTPIELCKIGTYQDKIFKSEGKNLFNDTIRQGVTEYNTGNYSSSNTRITSTNWTVLKKGTYTVNANTNTTKTLKISNITFDTNDNFYNISGISGQWLSLPITFTTPIDLKWKCNISFADSSNITPSQVSNIMLQKGNQATTYEPYNAKGKWLLHKEIGKVVLDGSEYWTRSTRPYYQTPINDIIINPSSSTIGQVVCNYFKATTPDKIWNDNENGITNQTDGQFIRLRIKDDTYTLETFKTWLSSNNLIVYYVLATPTNTEITDTTLISQLNAFEKAKTFEGTNNISVHGNLPAILDIDYWTYYKGETGRSIQNIMDEYALSTSSTEITGEWSTSVPTMTETNRYLWNRETITYSNPTSTQVGEPKIIGVYGLTGDTGKGIQSVTELYYVSSSNTTPAKPTSHVTTSSVTAYNTWNLQCSPYTTTYKYFYTCSEILYTDNTYGWTNVVQNQGLALANQNATNAMNKINNMKIGGRNLITESTYIKAPSETANWTAGLGNTITASYTDEGRIGTVPSTSFGEIQLFTTLEQINCKQTDEITFSCDVKLLPLDDESKPDVSDYVYLGYSLYYDGTTYSPNWYTGAQLQWVASTAGAKYDEWTRLNVVFPGYTGTVEYQRMMFGVIARGNQANSDIRFIVRNCKIEKGNQATDWTMAQEEIQDEFADVNNTFTKYVTKESYDSDWATYENEILGKVSKTYVTESDYTKFTEKAEAQFKLIPTGAQITASATQVFEDGIKGISETVDNIDETFTFTTNGLKIARSGNTMSLLLANDRLSFMNGEVEKAYMTSDAFVLDQLREFRLGNFAFKVRTNGSIDFLKVK